MNIFEPPLHVLLVFRCLLKKAGRPELSSGLEEALLGSLLLIMSRLSFLTGWIVTGLVFCTEGVALKNCSSSSAASLVGASVPEDSPVVSRLLLTSSVKIPNGSAVELVSDIVGLLADMSVSVEPLGSDWSELRLFELQYAFDCKPR